MERLSAYSDNCIAWNGGQFEKAGIFDLECTACSSESCFAILESKRIWRWEIDIPGDWRFGEWERVHLYPVRVKAYIIECNICGKKYRVYPSFAIPGTTLNISALIFIAFVYEYSPLTWRDIPTKFCRGYDITAHSTLFKAVHGLGLAIFEHYCCISIGIKELAKKHLSDDKGKEAALWPDLKSIRSHTIIREHALRTFLSSFLSFDTDYCDFFHLFHIFLKKTRIIMSDVDPPVIVLYPTKIYR